MGIHKRLQFIDHKVQVAVRQGRGSSVGRSFCYFAAQALRQRIQRRGRSVLARTIGTRVPDPDDDRCAYFTFVSERNQATIDVSRTVRDRVGRREQVLPVVHVQHVVTLSALVVARRKPHAHLARRDRLGRKGLIADILPTGGRWRNDRSRKAGQSETCTDCAAYVKSARRIGLTIWANTDACTAC